MEKLKTVSERKKRSSPIELWSSCSSQGGYGHDHQLRVQRRSRKGEVVAEILKHGRHAEVPFARYGPEAVAHLPDGHNRTSTIVWRGHIEEQGLFSEFRMCNWYLDVQLLGNYEDGQGGPGQQSGKRRTHGHETLAKSGARSSCLNGI